MADLTRVTASWAVGASTFAEGDLDVTGLDPDAIAELVDNQLHEGISLCHQCAGELSDPEVEELMGFSVGDVEYVKNDGHWVAVS